MLVLQRKKGQSILIGDDVKISIIDINSDGVKLAIDAPRNLKILRSELVEAAEVNIESVADKSQIISAKKLLDKRNKK